MSEIRRTWFYGRAIWAIIAAQALLTIGLAAAILFSFSGCRAPTPRWVSGTIDCGVDAVRKHGPALLPVVNRCLTLGRGDAWACLDGLPTAVGVGIDVVACVVRATGNDHAEAYADNSDDVLSGSMAERADSWIKHRGLEFTK